jgi:hypothetical protein
MSNQQATKVKGVVDIVFLIDATGSMAPCIDALKANISLFVDKLTSGDANETKIVKDWRAKVIGYRDFTVSDETPFEDNPFVREADKLKSQLTALSAKGGGDDPETLLDALYMIANMGSTVKGAEDDSSKWRYRSSAARVVVVFTDAPFKSSMVIPAASGGTVDDLINTLQAERIILSLFAPEMECFYTLAQCDKAEYNPIPVETGSNPQQALAGFTSDTNNFRKTLEALAKSVSASAATTAAI